jgi:8-oxo-dGTP diphosphatase
MVPESTAPDWEGVAVLCKSADGQALLMVFQASSGEDPTWAVPGGSIEPGETSQEVALRETKEETGLDVRIVCPYTIIEGVREYGSYRVHYFEAQVVGGQAQAADPDGLIQRVAWIPGDRLFELPLTHGDRETLVAFMGVSE